MKLIDIEKLPYKLVSIEHENGWENEVVVFAKDIDKQPNIEAIPVEWIKEYAERGSSYHLYPEIVEGSLKMMVEDWTEEGK